ncbi:DUF2510 domain-containing protein [Serinibacter arcticus]|uniref:DUF2510 domain-containing protein n=1 Tax=Serinibacter arcticus TaxID=1655435 RepID=UPI001304A04D|nr:DUF2510 domain-containing protein [Serinibacter arcticus]
MLTKEPGWYPDPQGVPQVRFWDGDTWTDYTQPFAPLETASHGPTTALADYPYLADANLRASDGPRTVSTWTPAPVLVPPTSRAPGRRRSGLVWWLVGGGALVVTILVVALGALGTGDGDAPVGADPSPSSTTTIDPIAVDVEARGTVPADGELRSTLEVTTDGAYLVVATSDEDVKLTLTPAGGTDPLPLPDDRGTVLADHLGGTWSDPGYYLHLTAGTYDVVVTEHDALQTEVTVLVEPATVVELPLGVATDVTVADYLPTVVSVPVDAAGTLLVDARAADPDAQDGQLTYDAGGRITSVDDRGPTLAGTTGGAEYDPLAEVPVEPGYAFVVLEDLFGASGTFSVTVTLG